MIRLFDDSERDLETDAEILMEPDGCCWFGRLVDGVQRWSHLGDIGSPSLVRAWCFNSGFGFAFTK